MVHLTVSFPSPVLPDTNLGILETNLPAGWTYISDNIGVEHIPNEGVQFNTRMGGWYTISLEFDNGKVWGPYTGYLPPRAILTVRPTSPPPTLGLLRPFGKDYDWQDGGGQGIDACGASGSVHDHDSVMQRHPCGLYNMVTGKLRNPDLVPRESYYRLVSGVPPWNKTAQLPEFTTNLGGDLRGVADATGIPDSGLALRERVLQWAKINGEHLIRAYRFGISLHRDAFVKRDMSAMLCDVRVAWDTAREEAILAGPPGNASTECGRDYAWSSYLAALEERQQGLVGRWLGNLTGSSFTARMRRIAKHVQHRNSSLLQRLQESWFYGQPHPWGDPKNGGSGVPHGIDVAQDLEGYAQVVALEALGMKRQAILLARRILSRPLAKWINTETGAPEGVHGCAHDQAWPALAAWIRMDPITAWPCVHRWKVPTNGGAWEGPYTSASTLYAAHVHWNDRGKNRWILNLLEKKAV